METLSYCIILTTASQRYLGAGTNLLLVPRTPMLNGFDMFRSHVVMTRSPYDVHWRHQMTVTFAYAPGDSSGTDWVPSNYHSEKRGVVALGTTQAALQLAA